MKCAKCQQDNNEVIDSREIDTGRRRRRRCVNCGHRWSTLETEVRRVRTPKRKQ